MNASNSTLPNGWTRKPLCELAHVKTGSRNNQDKDARGRYPFFVRSSQVERIDSFSYSDEAILIPGEGGIGSIFHYINGPHEVHQRVYRISDFADDIDPRYLYSYIARFFGAHAMQNTVKATVDSLRLPTFLEFVVDLPPVGEQRAIAAALTDAAAWVESLDALIAKKRDMFAGMCQMLLTGTQRLPGFERDWVTKPLGEIASFVKGSGLSKAALVDDGTEPCIHYGELFTKYPFAIDTVISRCFPFAGAVRSQDGDVLFPASDVTPSGLGTAASVMVEGVILGGDVLVARPDAAAAYGPFISAWIRTNSSAVLRLVKGSTVYHLHAKDLADLAITYPSLDEQHAIAGMLADASAEIDAVVVQRDKAELIRQGMAQDLLSGKVRLV